jgi:hypothetical protein
MRAYVLVLLSAGLCGCGDTSSGMDMAANIDMAQGATAIDMAKGSDGGGGGPSLVVNNTLDWCQVTVTIGSGAPATFTSASMSFSAPAGTTINLNAIPVPGSNFKPVKWTGVTTMNGAMATYTMTGAASQSITACCALADGSGCS